VLAATDWLQMRLPITSSSTAFPTIDSGDADSGAGDDRQPAPDAHNHNTTNDIRPATSSRPDPAHRYHSLPAQSSSSISTQPVARHPRQSLRAHADDVLPCVLWFSTYTWSDPSNTSFDTTCNTGFGTGATRAGGLCPPRP
jgi:hypothetical protein